MKLNSTEITLLLRDLFYLEKLKSSLHYLTKEQLTQLNDQIDELKIALKQLK
ncbi:hypothetical protein ACFQ4N_17800 [Oceanobacillus iheyensis]|uniref:hypothetical protein n=1 Tax=Oceanobacillus iheyensis TaxID=182710 RepID=UPI00031CD8A0|nr:hypothetical protein [Oceanobacillus iheyensis]